MKTFLGQAFLVITLFTAALGIGSDFQDVTAALFSPHPSAGGGVCWIDLNHDGFSDLVINGRIYRNDRGRAFVDATPEAMKPRGTAIAADFNQDGHPDLFFPAVYQFFTGDGNFHFSRQTLPQLPQSVSLGAAAADFDGDGLLDIYFSGYEIWNKNQSFPDYLLKNTGTGFEAIWQTPLEQTMRCHGGLSACDFNQDGRQELYVANYRLQPNALWFGLGGRNPMDRAREFATAGTERPNVIFKNEHGFRYCSSGHTISCLWGDFDNDGLFDLFVGNFSHPPKYQDRPQLLKNTGAAGNWHFQDKSAIAGLRWQESYAGSAAGDYNNDGRLDFLFTTVYKGDHGVLFRNEGNWKFTEDTGILNADGSYQAAWADFDNDGRLDLFTGGRLYRNRTPERNFIQFHLTGPAANRSAVGASVTLILPGQQQVRQVEAGTGCGCQNDLVLHFGLGNHPAAQSIPARIIWPDGRKMQLSVLPGRRHSIRR